MSSGHTWRVPVAWLLVAAALSQMAAAVLAVLHAVNTAHLTLAGAVVPSNAELLPVVLVVPLVLAGLACLVVQSTRGSRVVARVVEALVVLAALGDLARLGVLVATPPPRTSLAAIIAGLAAGLLVKLAGLLALVAAPRALTGAVPTYPPAAAVPQSRETAVALPDAASAPAPVPAVWNPDPTAGTVWRRAGDAATGAAGAVPATSGESGRGAPDWRPAPSPEGSEDQE